MDKELLKLGYASSNLDLAQEVEDEVRAKHPKWNDTKVFNEVKKTLEKATMFNAKNKKIKKVKKPKKDK